MYASIFTTASAIWATEIEERRHNQSCFDNIRNIG